MFLPKGKTLICIQSTLHTTYFACFFVKMISFFLNSLPVFDKSFPVSPAIPTMFRDILPPYPPLFYSYHGTRLFKLPVHSNNFVKLYAKSIQICLFTPFLKCSFLALLFILEAFLEALLLSLLINFCNLLLLPKGIRNPNRKTALGLSAKI